MIRREIEQIWGLAEDAAGFEHCYREANKVADRLANVGASTRNRTMSIYDQFSAIPRLARGKICIDRLGMPSIRRKRVG